MDMFYIKKEKEISINLKTDLSKLSPSCYNSRVIVERRKKKKKVGGLVGCFFVVAFFFFLLFLF